MPIDKYFAMIKEENGNIVIEVEEKEEKFDLKEEKVIDIVLGSLEDFKNFKESVNKGEDYTGKIIKQTADIDMGGAQNESWTPIGTKEYPFSGTYDGGKHTIKNLYIKNEEQDEIIGLFGYNTGTIKNLEIESGTIDAKAEYLSALCARNEGGTIEKCYNKATITGTISGLVGGICGQSNSGTIKQCYNSAQINVTQIGESHSVSGVVGKLWNSATCEECFNLGNITCTTDVNGVRACGIADFVVNGTGGRISSCYNKGTIKTISSSSWPVASGISGQIDGNKFSIEKCYNTGTISIEAKSNVIRQGAILGYLNSSKDDAAVSNYYWLNSSSERGIGQI